MDVAQIQTLLTWAACGMIALGVGGGGLLWLREAHFLMTWGLFALLLVHIGAALHHGWVRRDGVLRSMLRGD